MKLCWRAFDILLFVVHVQTRWRIRFWFQSSCQPQCDVCFNRSKARHFRAGNHVALAFFVSCTVHHEFLSRPLPINSAKPGSTPQDSRPNVSTPGHTVTGFKPPNSSCRLARNGTTCNTPQTPAVQYHLQQTACREDARRKACLPPHRKTCHRPQVR